MTELQAPPRDIPRTALLVEDEFMIAFMLANALERMGWGVLGPLSSGEEAVRKALAEKPDLVLMDVRLNGGMDGVEAAREIRAHLGVPIFFLTAQSDPQTTERMREVDSSVILNKPLRMTALREAVAGAQD